MSQRVWAPAPRPQVLRPQVLRPGDARTTVTITAEGTDLSGVVTSSRPKRCAADRVVVVVRQKGARGGGDDVRFATDTASLEGGVYRWSTGNTGTEGRFYARVRHVPGCKAGPPDHPRDPHALTG